MSGNAAGHTFVIGHGMAATVIAKEHINKKNKPTDEERAHEPMAKLQDVIDLIAVFGGVRGLAEKFVDQSKPTHIATSLPRSIARTVPADGEHNGRDKRGDSPGPINRLAHGQIDPDAIAADSQRQQGREDDKNNVKTFDRH